MKYRKLSLLSLLIAVLLMSSFPTHAAEKYTYTVRIFSGAQGTFSSAGASANGVSGSVQSGGSVVVYSGLKQGDRVTFNRNSIKLKDADKYYVMEMRESGKDNYDGAHPQRASVNVSGDQDYVVAYGIKGNTVACTINYQDKNGKALRESDTYYGNVGDEPVFASQYVDGYKPDSYNKIVKLADSGNKVTFVYSKIAKASSNSGSSSGSGNQSTSTGTTTNNGTGTGTGTGTTATGRPNTTAGTGTQNAAAQNNTTANNAADNTASQAENNGNETNEPSELTDIEGNEVPYASGPEDDAEEAEEEHSSKTPLIVTAICAAALLAGVIAFFLIRKKRSEE